MFLPASLLVSGRSGSPGWFWVPCACPSGRAERGDTQLGFNTVWQDPFGIKFDATLPAGCGGDREPCGAVHRKGAAQDLSPCRSGEEV